MVFEHYRQSLGDHVKIEIKAGFRDMGFTLVDFCKKGTTLEARFVFKTYDNRMYEHILRDSESPHDMGHGVSLALRVNGDKSVGMNYYFPEDAYISFQKKAK